MSMFDKLIEGSGDEIRALRNRIFPIEQRRLRGWLGFAVTLISVIFTLGTLYMAFRVTFGPIPTRAGHLAFALPLIFLLYPAFKRTNGGPTLFDYALAALAVVSFGWAVYSNDRFEQRFGFTGRVDTVDLVMGITAILVVFEATRRTVGMTIVWITVTFFVYALTGPYWPGLLQHRGRSLQAMIETLYVIPDGLFNFIMGIQATFLFTFLAFGAFLQVSGGDRLFTNFALALAGHRRGGPAKVAVISSALMGTLSGSTVSNVATTGTLTIPLMKRTGFAPHEAGAIESTASLGGALMPPIMGAGIFLMAAFTGIPLIQIMLYSIAPALLYYISLYFYIDIKARKKRLAGMRRDELPIMREVLKGGGHIILPVFALIYLLLVKYTPFFASSVAVVLVFLVSWLRRDTRMTLRKLVVALEASARIVITVSALSASAAIIFGVITATGLLVKMTSIILSITGGYLSVAMVFIAVMSYVLGMGLPVTASYVLIAALGAPALAELGIPLLAAHLIIFWFSQDSTITPPICMTAFVAARIAEAPPMQTGWQAVVMAKPLYIIPFVFAYGSLLDPSLVEILFDFGVLAGTFVLMPLSVEGYWGRPLTAVERMLYGLGSILFFLACIGPAADGLPWLAAAVAVTAGGLLLARRPAPQRAL
jgi:TRAP transporter 4TM/12TM fusion protein